MDFIHDRDERGGPFKWLSVVDEFTRECLTLEVERSIPAASVVELLVELFMIRGVPRHIRSDNGPEFIADAIKRLAALIRMENLSIEPGAPWQNGYAESFHSRLRDELLNAELFCDGREAKALAAAWRTSTTIGGRTARLGCIPPAMFASRRGAGVCPRAATLACPPGRG